MAIVKDSTIQILHSNTTTNVPTSEVTQLGELAVNIADKKLWVGRGDTSPAVLLGAGVGSSSTEGNTLVYNATNKAWEDSGVLSFSGSAASFTGSLSAISGDFEARTAFFGSKATAGTGLYIDQLYIDPVQSDSVLITAGVDAYTPTAGIVMRSTTLALTATAGDVVMTATGSSNIAQIISLGGNVEISALGSIAIGSFGIGVVSITGPITMPELTTDIPGTGGRLYLGTTVSGGAGRYVLWTV